YDIFLFRVWRPLRFCFFPYTTLFRSCEAFLVPAGTMIEVYATTLHYAPCSAQEKGFRCVVILPKGTNTELTFAVPAEGEARIMRSEEHTSELQSRFELVCRLVLE